MVTATAASAAGDATCVHEWYIESPNGPISIGRCMRCASVRQFRNSTLEDKRVNNSDLFASRRSGSRSTWNDAEADHAIQSMYRH